MQERVQVILDRLLADYPVLRPLAQDIAQAYTLLERCFTAGGKLLICGNGGSAADSEHIVGELMKGFLEKRALSVQERAQFVGLEGAETLAERLQGALPAISLCAHSALGSAVANDTAGDMVFAQQVWGYGQAGDCLLALSTSGNSANIVNALQTAKAKGMATIGITGERASKTQALADICLCLPEEETYRVQELTLPSYHALCAMLEAHFFTSI